MSAHVTLHYYLRVWLYNEAMCHQNVLEIEDKNQRNVKFRSAFLITVSVRLQNRNVIAACL